MSTVLSLVGDESAKVEMSVVISVRISLFIELAFTLHQYSKRDWKTLRKIHKHARIKIFLGMPG
jgi:hypothetical protein